MLIIPAENLFIAYAFVFVTLVQPNRVVKLLQNSTNNGIVAIYLIILITNDVQEQLQNYILQILNGIVWRLRHAENYATLTSTVMSTKLIGI